MWPKSYTCVYVDISILLNRFFAGHYIQSNDKRVVEAVYVSRCGCVALFCVLHAFGGPSTTLDVAK